MPRSSKSTTVTSRVSDGMNNILGAVTRAYLPQVKRAIINPGVMTMLLSTQPTPEITAHMVIGKKTTFSVAFFGDKKNFRSLRKAVEYRDKCMKARSKARRSVARFEVQKKKLDREEKEAMR